MKNKKVFALVVFGVLTVAAFFGYKYFSSNQKPKTVLLSDGAVVKMGEDTYEPQDFKVKKGTKIKFQNTSGALRWPASDLHPSHLVYPEFDSKEPVGKDGSWEFVFDQTGEWTYHDHLAPYITGIVIVTE